MKWKILAIQIVHVRFVLKNTQKIENKLLLDHADIHRFASSVSLSKKAIKRVQFVMIQLSFQNDV